MSENFCPHDCSGDCHSCRCGSYDARNNECAETKEYHISSVFGLGGILDYYSYTIKQRKITLYWRILYCILDLYQEYAYELS